MTEEEEYTIVRSYIETDVDSIRFSIQTESQVEYTGKANNDITGGDSPTEKNARQSGIPADDSIQCENQDKKHRDRSRTFNSSTRPLDSPCSYDQDDKDTFSPFVSLSDLEDTIEGYDHDSNDDHKSIECNSTYTSDSPLVITPNTQPNRGNESFTQKGTAATSYFDLDNEDHHPRRCIQSIIDCIN